MVCSYCRLLVERGFVGTESVGDEDVFFGTIPNSDILVSLVQLRIILISI